MVDPVPLEDKHIQILRNRILENLWRDYKMNSTENFHFTNMNRQHVRGYLQDQLKLDEAQYSDDSTEFKRILHQVYSPLLEYGLIEEYENNNFRITDRLKEICQRELRTKEWIDWNSIAQRLP